MRRVAPRHLSDEAGEFWREMVYTWAFEEHQEMILTAACEAWDIAQQARKAVAEEGATFTDRFGQPKENPACKIARQHRAQFARLLRELGLDLSDDDIRPPRVGGGYT